MSTETILIVDDSEQNLNLLEASLVGAGYVTHLASSGTQAIQMFKENTPDLVLMDVLMPEMDGFETCKHIRSLPQGVDVPIVFLTAMGDLQSHQKALDAGGDDLLTKPINRTELLLRVRSMAWLHRLRFELRSGYNLIRSQRDALLRAQQQKDELTNLIVHDLKNPLTNIIGYAELLLQHKELKLEQTKEVAQRVISCGKMMERMVMNLLDINRSEDGVLTPKIGKVDISQLIDDVQAEMEARAAEKSVKLIVSKTISGNTLRADPDLIRRLLENLLDNSVRYAPTGTMLNLDARTMDENILEIRVRDQGRGIAKEHREKIFEKYVQIGNDTPNQTRSNRGLGLTFCRMATEAHHGKIWVEDNQPKGACFCVQLPYAPDSKDIGD